MRLDIFTVHDVVSEKWGKPFFGDNAASAIRGFSEVCKDEGHEFAKHPSDYSLYHVGSFETDSGKIEAMSPRQIAEASSFSEAPSARGPIVDERDPYLLI